MIELVVLVFMANALVLSFLYFTDRELKLLLQIGLGQYKLLSLNKWKYFFVFYKRKEGIITKHAYVCMIAYYIVNGIEFIWLFIQIITGNNSFISETCMVQGFSNIGLLAIVVIEPRLTPEEKRIKFEYLEKLGKDLKRQKEEKKIM